VAARKLFGSHSEHTEINLKKVFMNAKNAQLRT